MKTFRMIGMALFAFLMCVNFAACSSDDEPTEEKKENIVTNEKKLIEMKDVSSDGGTGQMIFTYDSKGRLISKKGGVTGDTNYTWGDKMIMAEDYWGVNTYTLNSKNLVENIKDSDDEPINFTYNIDNQIVTFGDFVKYHWENGKLIKKAIDNDYYSKELTYTYSEKTCKGYFPLYAYYYFDDDYEISLVHPELFGLRSSQLPTQIRTKHENGHEYIETFTYTFYDDGYIETCTYSDDNYKTIYTFIWK